MGAARSPTPFPKVPGVVDMLNGIENTISGPGHVFQVDPTVAARAGFTPEEVALDAVGDSGRRAGGHPGDRTGHRLHHSRALSRTRNRTSLAAMSNTLLISSTGHTATWARWPRYASCRDRRRFGAKICSATSR